MKLLTQNESKTLLRAKTGPAVTMYLDVSDRGQSEDFPSRVKKLISRMETKLDLLFGRSAREQMIERVTNLMRTTTPTRDKNSVAIYHSDSLSGAVYLKHRVEDLAIASDSFHIKPLLKDAQLSRHYKLLVVRRKNATLYRCLDSILTKVDEISWTKSVGDSDQAQNQTATPGIRQIFRDPRLRKKLNSTSAAERILRHFGTRLHKDDEPILLCGRSDVLRSLRLATKTAPFIDHEITLKGERVDLGVLVATANKIIESHFEREDIGKLDEFYRANSFGQGSTDLVEIAKAAALGQIRHLFISGDRHVWGKVDRNYGHVKFASGQDNLLVDDMLDDIAEIVISKGGNVTVLPNVQMPYNKDIAAIMRWNKPGLSVVIDSSYKTQMPIPIRRNAPLPSLLQAG